MDKNGGVEKVKGGKRMEIKEERKEGNGHCSMLICLFPTLSPVQNHLWFL